MANERRSADYTGGGMTLGNAFPAAVKMELAQGYGVEDISIRLGCSEGAVRTVVRDMNFAGELSMFYRNARRKWRHEAT